MHDSSFDEVQVPVEFATRIRLQAPQHPVEHADLPPPVEPPRYGVDSILALRQIRPGRTRVQDPEQATHNWRESSAGRPVPRCCFGSSGAICAHCALVVRSIA